jgi:SAM-dependent methyltransferase
VTVIETTDDHREADYYNREEPPILPAEKRMDMTPVELPWNDEQAITAALRCFQCDTVHHVDESTCILCGACDGRPVQRFVVNGEALFTVRCVRDGMMWLDPRPSAAFYERLYAAHYYGVGPDDPLFEQASLPVQAPEAQLRVVAGWRMDEIERFAAPEPGGGPRRLLEVGFGAGYVLDEARARGWLVFGLESARSCVADASARGIPARCGTLADVAAEGETFDAVAMYSVLEHVLYPQACLREAHALIRPKGVLALRLPETADEGPPASLLAHVYHFNKDTIRTVLRRCGFEVVHAETAGIWRPTRYPGELPHMNVLSRKPT